MTSDSFKRSAEYQWHLGARGLTSPGGASPTKEDTHSRLSDMGGGGMRCESVGYEVWVLGFLATPEVDGMVSADGSWYCSKATGFRGNVAAAVDDTGRTLGP